MPTTFLPRESNEKMKKISRREMAPVKDSPDTGVAHDAQEDREETHDDDGGADDPPPADGPKR